ncbi:uncharacterized protein LOC124147319 [Haliotis rufescens]|uniref:uncharacterized protein LOC124147319 n=1 Tax=Haliotis rufescens TaxID=6454 RepID=UPI001EB06B5C|nr:uncharacterized protein LOC124147319 [Haliotis rufescens]
MTEQSRMNIINGVASLLVVACGVIYSSLIGALIHKAKEFVQTQTGYNISFADLPVWALGFAYIVPGIIGVIATVVRAKGGYITHMVFSILTLLIMGIFAIVGIIALGALATANIPSCSSLGDKSAACAEAESIYGMGVGAIIMIVFGWIFALVSTILSGIMACKPEHVSNPVQFGSKPY